MVNPSYSDLEALLDRLDRSSGMQDLAWTSEWLARLVGRSRPWSANYLASVLRGDKGMGPERTEPLRRAVRAGLAVLEDGVHPVQASHTDQSVLVPPGADVAGALVSASARDCAAPGCPFRFVSNHPRRIYCYVCSPPKGD